MTKNKYPDLTFDNVFQVYSVGQNMKREPNYLEESPYPDMIKRTLKAIYPVDEAVEIVKPTTLIDIADLDIKTETEFLYLETKKLLNARSIDEKDRASIIKTATGQMEKLITLIERANNIKYMREFEAKVLNTLKKVLPEKREEFLEELTRLEEKDGIES